MAILQWEENWKGIESELGKDAMMPALWRMSVMLEICPKDVKDHLMVRLGEIGENYENFKAKVVSHTTNKRDGCTDGGRPW